MVATLKRGLPEIEIALVIGDLLPSGVYILALRQNGHRITRKVAVLGR